MNQSQKKEVNIDREVIGDSSVIQNIKKLILKIAPTNYPILLAGERGVGKGLVAKLLHQYSNRSNGPFIQINLAALNKDLVDAELFGYAKGAFTGADSEKTGLLEIADGGTVFLEELENSDVSMQAKLLRVTENQSFIRLGDTHARKLNIRIITSISSNYDKAVREGQIRADLFYRLAISILNIPPLRERKDDIPELVDYFLENYIQEGGNKIDIGTDALKLLREYDFPGNIRELNSIINRAATICRNNIISFDDLGIKLLDSPKQLPDFLAMKSKVDNANRIIENLRQNSIIANPIWEGRSFPLEDDYCFVLMPFTDKADLQKVYLDHIKPLVEKKCSLRCQRADDIYDISGVMQSVWEGINRAKLIIADLTEKNSNVFYELGIAHTLGKPVIMLTQSMDYIPFDLRHLRCIVYEYKPNSIIQFEQSLERTIRRVLSSIPNITALNMRQEKK